MLRLRSDQISMFEKRSFDALHARIQRAIERSFPELATEGAIPPAIASRQTALQNTALNLGEFIGQGIERAMTLDMQHAPDIAALIALMLSLRVEPASEPIDWMKPWLTRPDTSGQVRLEMIAFQITQIAGNDLSLQRAAKRMASARKHAE